MYDVIIVGGSYAGLSAALQLARARRQILIIDAGERRNRFANHAHGFLTQDGTPPGEIAAIARRQVLAYPTVTLREGRATDASGAYGRFTVTLDDGSSVEGKRVILAIGVRDELPSVPGLAERWGQSVYHCPYCHGYELGDGPIGVLAVMPSSIHQALMLPHWGKTTYFLNGLALPSHEEMAELNRRGVTIESTPIRRLVGERADIELEDGRVIPIAGLFTASRTTPVTPLAEQLGCAMVEAPNGIHIATDVTETTVPGVFAAGDVGRAMGSVTLAVGDGAMAGMAAHRTLIFGDD